jgi:pimeloyl-ACP methyl ester carboxylesterase
MGMGRKIVLNLLIVVFFFVGVFLLGPFFSWTPVAETPEVKVIEAAGDLDRYLSDFESKVEKLKPELARGIVWNDPLAKKKTPISIVYIHGFSASRREMYPVWDEVAQALGANLYFARLKGHGLSDGEAMGDLTAQDFLDEGRVALAIGRRLGDQVILVGMSTGATIVLHLANENRDAKDIRAMVLVSPNHMPATKSAKFISGPFGRLWARLFIGSHRSFETLNELHAKYWTPHYRSEAIPAMMDLVKAAEKIDLSKIQIPTLTLYTKKDTVVDVGLIESRHAEIGASKKQIVDLPEADRHEFASDAIAPQAVAPTVQAVLDFLL